MRVSTSQMQFESINAMLDQQAKLSKTQLQLSSGRRILTPSDDPSGSKQILDLGQAIAVTQQYGRNADAAEARLNLEETQISSGVDLLQRARELTVQALNGTATADQRQAAALEIRQLQEQMVTLSNSKDANGEYLFAGYQTDTEPFTASGGSVVYNGDQGQKTLQIGDSRRIATGDSGSAVFMKIPGTAESVFSTLDKLATELESNTPNSARLDDIDASMKNLVRTQTAIGARLNAISAQRDVNSAALLQMQQNKSSVEDLDYASAVSELNKQMVGLQAAQQSYVKIQGLSLFNYL